MFDDFSSPCISCGLKCSKEKQKDCCALCKYENPNPDCDNCEQIINYRKAMETAVNPLGEMPF